MMFTVLLLISCYIILICNGTRASGSLFNNIGTLLRPTFSDMSANQSTLTKGACAFHCSLKLACIGFFHNPTDLTCILWDYDVSPVARASENSSNEDNFNLFLKIGFPETCSDLQLRLGTDQDGEYWLHPPSLVGLRARIYCHDMNTASPREYVTLSAPNYGYYPPDVNLQCRNAEQIDPCAGNKPCGRVDYTKIGVDIHTMTVNRGDHTFATSDAAPELLFGYGSAGDCYNEHLSRPSFPFTCGPKGTSRIDTSGTGLIFNNQTTWSTEGWRAVTFFSWQDNGRAVNITCGGWCGRCDPDVLKLELDPHPPVLLP